MILRDIIRSEIKPAFDLTSIGWIVREGKPCVRCGETMYPRDGETDRKFYLRLACDNCSGQSLKAKKISVGMVLRYCLYRKDNPALTEFEGVLVNLINRRLREKYGKGVSKGTVQGYIELFKEMNQDDLI